MDLIRAIVLKLEQVSNKPGVIEELLPGEGGMVFPGFSPEEVAYHLELVIEAGFLVTHGTMLSGEILFERLSVDGHDFADSVRSPEIWAKTKKGAEAAGGFTIDLLKDLGKGFIKKQVEDLTGVKL